MFDYFALAMFQDNFNFVPVLTSLVSTHERHLVSDFYYWCDNRRALGNFVFDSADCLHCQDFNYRGNCWRRLVFVPIHEKINK